MRVMHDKLSKGSAQIPRMIFSGLAPGYINQALFLNMDNAIYNPFFSNHPNMKMPPITKMTITTQWFIPNI